MADDPEQEKYPVKPKHLAEAFDLVEWELEGSQNPAPQDPTPGDGESSG